MSSAILARVGRHKQLYENGFRLVAGCIPYRLKPEGTDLIYRLEVLMISTPKRHDLVFPKGGWENDETVCEAAIREALEEAGVEGILNETKLGEWTFRSKSRQSSSSNEGACKGYMFALEVKKEHEFWPEQSTHKRTWVSVRDASRLCRYPWMREALASCLELLSESHSSEIERSSSATKRENDVSEPSSYYRSRENDISEPSKSNYYFNVNPTAPERAIDAIC
ncbi:uncharacterized protein A4U43_C02F13960 [Asparagus officinalis]|uniref:Nudix hydrolase domain-containing protein n=1 Tax=Asparagus officinalis TaxID=4686 RepID=A0A5P1FIB2_ASPOF|nr:nudix hydrolase 12, mitochondrial-like isoform X2 [Asparagus officinalis]ONK78068.1 uncharacterized protein A4U43_C02F13960 [Asparagus officinalis]